MTLVLINEENKSVEADSGGNFKVVFPEPTIVGKSQTVEYVLRNVSKKDRFEIIGASAGDGDLGIEIKKGAYLYPNDETRIKITYSPKDNRKVPLQNAKINIKVWRIIEPEI